nr:uncharacterized protein LOC110377154 isoform X1 [Helicoverpa armigera]
MAIKLHTIGLVLFLMMEPLPMNVKSSGLQRILKNSSLCVSGKWIKVGSFRFWKRTSCAERRDAPAPAKLPGDELDDMMPSAEAGPKRNETYNPTYGYEPYWVDGEWVFDKPEPPGNGSDYMCGLRCPPMYSEYGTICGRDKKHKYQTFENYCALRNFDCNNTNGWTPLYKGRCYRDLLLYNRHYLKSRAREHISSFMAAHTSIHSYVGYVSKKRGESFA